MGIPESMHISAKTRNKKRGSASSRSRAIGTALDRKPVSQFAWTRHTSAKCFEAGTAARQAGSVSQQLTTRHLKADIAVKDGFPQPTTFCSCDEFRRQLNPRGGGQQLCLRHNTMRSVLTMDHMRSSGHSTPQHAGVQLLDSNLMQSFVQRLQTGTQVTSERERYSSSSPGSSGDPPSPPSAALPPPPVPEPEPPGGEAPPPPSVRGSGAAAALQHVCRSEGGVVEVQIRGIWGCSSARRQIHQAGIRHASGCKFRSNVAAST